MPSKTEESPQSLPFSGCVLEPSDLTRFLDLCKLRSEMRVLDVATGRGAVAFLLSTEGACDVVGIDVCGVRLAQAVRMAIADAGPEFVCADASRLPFEDASFDLVVTRRGPHHFADIEAALDEIHRVLVPGGRFVVDDRSVPEDVDAGELWNELDRLHAPSHVQEYAPSVWRRMLEAREFAVESLEPYERELPLDLMLEGTESTSAHAIEKRLDSLDIDQRALLGLRRDDGVCYLRHNYVRLAARKRA